jgi:hypothetical protein
MIVQSYIFLNKLLHFYLFMSLMDLHKYLTFKSSQKALNIETIITLIPNDLNIHFISKCVPKKKTKNNNNISMTWNGSPQLLYWESIQTKGLFSKVHIYYKFIYLYILMCYILSQIWSLLQIFESKSWKFIHHVYKGWFK